MKTFVTVMFHLISMFWIVCALWDLPKPERHLGCIVQALVGLYFEVCAQGWWS